MTLLESSQSQISFIAWKIRKIGEASADTAATETSGSTDHQHLPCGLQAKATFFITHEYKYTKRPILAIFHGTIFSGGKRPRDKIFKWSSCLKELTTADLVHSCFIELLRSFSLNATTKQLPESETISILPY